MRYRIATEKSIRSRFSSRVKDLELECSHNDSSGAKEPINCTEEMEFQDRVLDRSKKRNFTIYKKNLHYTYWAKKRRAP